MFFSIIFFQGRDGYSNLKSAFFVAINKTYLLQENSAIIVWDDVILNKNNNLNNNTGIYYAPINGLYEFSLTVCVPANHIVCFSFIRNDLIIFVCLIFRHQFLYVKIPKMSYHYGLKVF